MHLTTDVLALLAVGEQSATPAEVEHLDGCPDCRRELADMSAAVELARHVTWSRLDQPHPRVWQQVAAEIGLPAEIVRDRPEGRLDHHEPVLDDVDRAETLGSRHVVASRAILRPQPEWPLWSGWAVVEIDQHGHRRLEVTVAGPSVQNGTTRVWLRQPDAETGAGKQKESMVAVGVLRDGLSTFELPLNIDLDHFRLVDVSCDPEDGTETYSGDSLLRGILA